MLRLLCRRCHFIIFALTDAIFLPAPLATARAARHVAALCEREDVALLSSRRFVVIL